MSRRSCVIYSVGMVSLSLLTVAIGFIVAQVCHVHVSRSLNHYYLKKKSVLVEGSRVFESWNRPSAPVFTEFFFFNVTNVDAFLAGATPQVTQVGPYTYRQYRYIDNVSMVENGTKVSADNTKRFVFLREKSVGDPSEQKITTVNMPVWAVMNALKNSFWKTTMMSVWLNSMGIGLFTTRTVDELLWGYEDPLLARLATTDPTKFNTIFGLMVKGNETNSGEFVNQTGEQNYLDYGHVVTWKGQSQLTFWTSSQSNSISGTDRSAFHPLLDKNQRIYVFSPDFCRSVYMEYEKDVEVKGIPSYRFTLPRSVLASKEENPANESCVSPEECLGTGLLKVSHCHNGAPVVVSFPHFYLADEKYVAAIEGMSPEKILHQTFLDLNPTTGEIVRANKGVQVNYLIKRMSGFQKTRTLQETIFPVMFYNEKSVLVEGSRVFESWNRPSAPVFTEFFFFNVTNVDAFLAGATPQVTQVGPYTYRQYRYIDNVSMVENGTKVSADNTKRFVFLREKSVGDPSEQKITTVNMPVWAVMNGLSQKSFILRTLIAMYINSEKLGIELFTTRTVDELLWGYEDPLLARLASLNPKVDTIFGLMVKENDTNSGEFVYQTSEQNYLDYGRVGTWKGQSQLTFWTSDQSNSISGTDGSAFHPLLDKNQRIYVFSPDFCRSVYMEYEKDVEVKGIPSYRFTLPRSVLASKEEGCVSPEECLGTGLLKVSHCHNGAPVVVSFPHFYLADEKYVAAIEGMSPEKILHQTFLDLNPTTGEIVRANKGVQVNYLIKKMRGFTQTKTLQETIFPVMFYNETTSKDEAQYAAVGGKENEDPHNPSTSS